MNTEKKELCQHTSGNECFPSLNGRFQSKFYLQLTKYIHSTRSKFYNSFVLIAYQVTIHNKCPKCPPSESMHARACLLMDCGSRCRRGCEFSDMYHKYVGKQSRHFKLELNTLGLLIVSTDKTLKGRVQNLVGLYLKNCLRTYIHTNIFLLSV
jgi:hypothetical protein